MLNRFMPILVASVVLCTAEAIPSYAQQTEDFLPAPARITAAIDTSSLVALRGNVRPDATPEHDLGPVEDGLPLRLYLVLKRSPEQQIDLDTLLARQQQPTAPEYHQWLTPKSFGARFGASPQDIEKLTEWLESNGFKVHGALNDASFIDFSATAGQVRDVFHTELHYFEIGGGKHPALTADPMIPSALGPVVAGIDGLNKVPLQPQHTKPGHASYDAATHRWHNLRAGVSPAYNAGSDEYDVTPQDFYTIYNVNSLFNAGTRGAGATVAVIEESDIEYGSVNSTTHAAQGGDVATFRKLFGVSGTLNMHVYHGYGHVTCNDPGIDPNANGEEAEAALDAEWANALAPAANLVFMSCDSVVDDGIITSILAVVDNSLADSLSMSYGSSELSYTSTDYSAQDTYYAQAAAQGQSFFVSSGDSGSDVADQNTSDVGTSGINVNAFASSPNVTSAGGTDFADQYDDLEGGPAQSNYWNSANTAFYGDAKGYVPETAWNESCGSSILARYEGYSGAGLCAQDFYFTFGDVVAGSGGFSTHYPAPAYQSGTPGFAATKRAQPDISGFASAGFWGHALIYCDSYQSASACADASTFGEAGGTSFVAPYTAGIAGLLVNYTGSRQGLWNPTLYALAKAQFTAAATKTACYSNGQTSNTGVTTSLPAAACIFHDVTTSNNDVPCLYESTNCYVESDALVGMLSRTNAASLTVAFPSTVNYDEATGVGTPNVYNLVTGWKTAFTSTTTLAANPTSVTNSESTKLTATVKGGTPAGYTGKAPALNGSVKFTDGTTVLGSCTLSSGACSLTVSGSALKTGANSITATFAGSTNYPASTSKIVTVTKTAAQTALPVFTPAGGTYTTARGVSISDATAGAVIYYTTNGTQPTTSSTRYSKSITVSSTETIEAIAIAAGDTESGTVKATYTID